MTTANEFRTIAEQVNAEKVQMRHLQLVEFIDGSILPAMRKKAEAGHFGHRIENTRGFYQSEVMAELENRGFSVKKTVHNDIMVSW